MPGHLRSALTPLALALSVAAAVPGAAAAATDAPVAEVSSSSAIAVHGSTLAWIEDDDGGEIVLRRPGRTRRFDVADAYGLSLGRDERGRLALVYSRCVRIERCVLSRVDVRTGRRRTVAGIRGAISYPTLRRGVLAWCRGTVLTCGRARSPEARSAGNSSGATSSSPASITTGAAWW